MTMPDNVIALDHWRKAHAPTAQDVARHPAAASERVQQKSPGDVIKVTIRMLTRKDLTVHELSAALRKAEFGDDEIQRAIEMAMRDGYLDDVRVAAQAARRAFERKLWSDRAVRSALCSRGVSNADIDIALSELAVDEAPLTESERALQVTDKSLRGYAGLEFDVVRRRLTGKLQRRGFSMQAIREMVEYARTQLEPNS